MRLIELLLEVLDLATLETADSELLHHISKTKELTYDGMPLAVIFHSALLAFENKHRFNVPWIVRGVHTKVSWAYSPKDKAFYFVDPLNHEQSYQLKIVDGEVKEKRVHTVFAKKALEDGINFSGIEDHLPDQLKKHIAELLSAGGFNVDTHPDHLFVFGKFVQAKIRVLHMHIEVVFQSDNDDYLDEEVSCFELVQRLQEADTVEWQSTYNPDFKGDTLKT